MLVDADRALREQLVPPRVLAAEDRARFGELLAASSIGQHTEAERKAMEAARRWLAALPDRWMDVDDLPRLLGVYRDRRETWGEDHDTAMAYTLTEADYEPSQSDLTPGLEDGRHDRKEEAVEREHVTIEVENGSEWHRLGSVADVEPPASFSTQTSHGREVYVAGWIGEQGPGVWRAAGGLDATTDAFRELFTAGFVHVADLRTGPHTLELSPGCPGSEGRPGRVLLSPATDLRPRARTSNRSPARFQGGLPVA